MARQIFAYRNGQFVQVRRAKPQPRVHIISDDMRPVFHPCTGEMMDSKSAFREVTRAHGCTEVGDQPLTASTPHESSIEEIKQEVAEVYNDLT